MGFLIGALIFLTVMVIWLIFYLRKGNFKESDQGFEQADVFVNYKTGRIRIKKYEYDVNAVQTLQWSGGGGEYGNHSTAWIEIDDMNKPSHKLDFARATDASDFVTRLNLAIKKAGGSDLKIREQ